MSRVALVTGGAVRVGRAISLGLAEAGFDVAVNYHTSESAAREVEGRVRELGRRALLVPGDVARAADVDRVLAAVADGLGRLDLLVNSASLFQARAFEEIDEDEWDRVMAVNLKGPFLLAQRAAGLLRASRGAIVNVVDLSALQPWTSHPHHAVSKAGLLHLTRVLARALAPDVRVNAVAPGTVLPPDDMGAAAVARERAKIPLGELGDPEDVVRTVRFLAEARFVTGEVIVVDGGEHLGG